MKKLKASTRDHGAITSVLTDRFLWLAITDYQCGLPLHYHPIRHDVRAVAARDWVPHRTLASERFQAHITTVFATWFATYGLPAVRQLHASCGSSLVRFAAYIGHLPTLASLLLQTPFADPTLDMTLVWNFAARNGHAHVIRFLHDHQVDGCTSHAMDTAAANGHLPVVRFLHEFRGEGCTKDAMDLASFQGFLDVVEFLHLHRREGCTKLAMTWAARLDKLQIVRFLSENRTEGCTKKALDWAARHGHLGVVQYLHVHRHEGCPDTAILEAAKEGYVDIVRYLGCHADAMWVRRAMERAVATSDLKLVRLLVEHGCDGGVDAGLEAALTLGHSDIAHYLLYCLAAMKADCRSN
ncbi:Aste57867_22683 [Aphanomyces stellatus]|uniref:Aste57867_22683 protein n=1 Tax=Aphanomyces stellatus TaxID=120398 RepID=A0A485LMD6_9STRA|nr:hypothetical protein As57867_022613 [Aphanomyces stellatus]VFT99337.1 Aste57867_22683 [Aphanomyces stellatus]